MINRIEKEEVVVIKTVESVTCDICGKTYGDTLEIQEFHYIHFEGGYNSVFGDESYIECDVCQYCLFDMIKDKYRES